MTRRISQFFWIILLGIVILAASVRTRDLHAPLADWHSFRQADTASVTREYIKHGIDILRPHYQDLSNIQSGKDNPEGWRMVEFPLENAVIAWIIRLRPSLDLVVFSRIVSIGFSIFTLIGIAILGKRLYSPSVGLLGAIFFAFLPYSIYYSRVILPEPFLLALSTWSLLCFVFAVGKQKTSIFWVLCSTVLLALALLVKPTAVFFLPAFLGVVLWRRGLKGLLDFRFYIGVLAVLPLLWWRQWITQFPDGIPVSEWLLNGNGIRLKPAWFRWLFADRLGRLILGYWGTGFLALGLIGKNGKKEEQSSIWVLWLWGIGMLAYFVVIATGNVQHDYYQNLIIPFVALAAGKGFVWLCKQTESGYRFVAQLTAIVVLVFTFAFSWYEVEGYFSINHPEIVEAGKAVDALTPPDAKVIAPYMGDTAFLFQTNRTGWPLGFDIQKKIDAGATYYVSTNYDDETNALIKQYQVVQRTDKYVIINLQQKVK